MSRLGIFVVAILVLGGALFASMVRVSGPRSAAPSLAIDQRVLTRPPLPPAPPSGLLLPVQGVSRSALRDSWDDSRGGGARSHHALDIPAASGTPVFATADGRIEKLFDSKLGGHTIYQRSADGRWVYYYAHLDHYAPTMVEGQAVKQGDVIAAVGSTGDANPAAPHLHFEIHRMAPGERWWQGEGVDPYPMLARR